MAFLFKKRATCFMGRLEFGFMSYVENVNYDDFT